MILIKIAEGDKVIAEIDGLRIELFDQGSSTIEI